MELTQERLKELLDYSPDTGLFYWRERPVRQGTERTYRSWNIRNAGNLAGDIMKGRNGQRRFRIRIFNKGYLAHRLAWLWMTGNWPKDEIDHVDVNALNNKWDNLREATHSQNGMNRHGRGRHGKGVYFHRQSGLFCARIHVEQKCKTIGYFKSDEAARGAYAAAAKILHGEFARIS